MSHNLKKKFPWPAVYSHSLLLSRSYKPCKEKRTVFAKRERISLLACLNKKKHKKVGSVNFPASNVCIASKVNPWSSSSLFLYVCAECVHQAVSQAGASLRAALDEERRKYQGLLREFTRLEQRYDNLREMSLLTEVHNYTYRHTKYYFGLKLHLGCWWYFFLLPHNSTPRATEGLTPPRVWAWSLSLPAPLCCHPSLSTHSHPSHLPSLPRRRSAGSVWRLPRWRGEPQCGAWKRQWWESVGVE